LIVFVPESAQKPHKVLVEENKWLPYVRIEDETLAANRITVGVWMAQQNPIKRPDILTDKQLDLLRAIHKSEPCSISFLYKQVKLQKRQIDQLLVLFILWGLVRQDIFKESVSYSCMDVQKIDW